MDSKKIMIFVGFLSITVLTILIYRAKPVKEFDESDYLIIAQSLEGKLYSNRYSIEQPPFMGKYHQHNDIVGYTRDSIFISTYYFENLHDKKTYFLSRYVLKDNNLVIAETIDLAIPILDGDDWAKMLLLDSNNVYYYQYSSKELIQYNIINHRKKILSTINNCREMWEFDGKYIHYSGLEPNPYIVSRLDRSRLIDVARFDYNNQIKLIPGTDMLLILHDYKKLSFFNIITKEKTYIRDLDTSFFIPLYSKNKIMYLNFHLNPLRVLHHAEPCYYDFMLFDLKTGEENKIYSLHGTWMEFMAINLNDYPAFRAKQ